MNERMRDETLIWLNEQLKQENAKRPPEKRIGLRRYLREVGILSPDRIRIIARREIPFSYMGTTFGEEFADGEDEE